MTRNYSKGRVLGRWRMRPRLVVGFFVPVLVLMWFSPSGHCAPATPTAEHSKQLSIVRDDGHSFKLSRPGSPTVRVTFLAAETFRVHLLPDEEEEPKLPEYMVVKSEASYPPVDVRVESHQDEATFRTAAAAIHIVASDGVISVDVRTQTKTSHRKLEDLCVLQDLSAHTECERTHLRFWRQTLVDSIIVDNGCRCSIGMRSPAKRTRVTRASPFS